MLSHSRESVPSTLQEAKLEPLICFCCVALYVVILYKHGTASHFLSFGGTFHDKCLNDILTVVVVVI